MYFEVRLKPPEVSEAYAACRDLYVAGKTLEAAAEAERIRDAGGPQCPQDFMLYSDIARSCGDYVKYQAVAKIGYVKYPGDWKIVTQYARALAGRYRLLKANRILEQMRGGLQPGQIPLLDSFIAANTAMSGLRETAATYERRALDAATDEEPLLWYELAYMASTVTNWEKAVEYGYHTLKIAPRWQRARTNLVFSLLARGRADEAHLLIREGLSFNIEDESLDFTAGMFEFARGRFGEAARHMERHCKRWLAANTRKYVANTLAITLWEMKKYDEALKYAAICGGEADDTFRKATPTGKHRLIPLNLVCQRTRECVPTSAAMVSAAQGVMLNMDELLREMDCRDGTPVWKMCQVMEAKGFHVVSVRAEPEIIREFLDRGVPLIGTLEGFFSSHVEVICGYARDLSLFYIRDPSMWYPYAIPEKALAERYRLHANSVIAIVAPGGTAKLEEWVSSDGMNLLLLARACTKGELETAEMAYSRISDSSDAAFLRDVTSARVAITPAKFMDNMKKLAFDSARDPQIRGKALLCLRTPEGNEELGKLAGENNWGYFMSQYAEMLKQYHECRWGEAEKAIANLLEKQSGMETLWSYHSDVRAEQGDLAGAHESLRKALEISPFSVMLKEKAMRLHMDLQRYEDQLSELTKVMAENPDAHYLRFMLSMVLAHGPDGFAYEKADQECMRFFPRDPSICQNLAGWYLYQDREDLAAGVLARGRRLMGEDELPLHDFEKDKPGNPPPHPRADETEQLFAAAERALAERKYDCNAADLDPVKQLVELDAARKLNWFNSARLLALRVSAVIYRPGQETDLAGISAILPAAMYGPATVAVTAVLSRFDYSYVPRAAAVLLLEWAGRMTQNVARTKGVRFYMALLLERADRMQEAIAEYEAIRKEFPGDPSVLYRLGESYSHQSRVYEAIEAYEASLKLAPGLHGAMERLVFLYDQVGRYEDATKWQEAMCALYPYHFDHFSDLIRRIEKEKGSPAAVARVEQAIGGVHRAGELKALKAYLLARAGRYEAVEETLKDGEAERENEYLVIHTRLLVAAEKHDDEKVRSLTRRGMEKWPGAVWFLQEYARVSAAADPAGVRELIRAYIVRGDVNDELAALYFSTEKSWADAAIEILNLTPARHKDHVAGVLAATLTAPERYEDNIRFLQWCNANFRHAVYLRIRLAELLDISGRRKEALDIAKSLYAEDENDPVRMNLMGRCLQDTDPREALKHLEREYALSRSVDCLRLQARSHQLLGDAKKARELYWQVVKDDPNSAISLSNLFILGESGEKLMPLMARVIEHGGGIDDQYFHAAALKTALALGQKLPAAWLAAAKLRHRVMLTQEGFRDERNVLELALASWLCAWGRDAEAKAYASLPRRLYARFIWPRTKWVPASPAAG